MAINMQVSCQLKYYSFILLYLNNLIALFITLNKIQDWFRLANSAFLSQNDPAFQITPAAESF